MMKYIIMIFFCSIFMMTSCNNDADIQYEVTCITNSDYGIIKLECDVLENMNLHIEKDGFTFVDWYWDIEFQNRVVMPYKLIEDVTIYAKWQENRKYKISFETYYGTPLPDLFVEEGVIPDLPINYGEEYGFKGWYLDQELTKLYVSKPLNSNLKLYASYGENQDYKNYLEFNNDSDFYEYYDLLKIESKYNNLCFNFDDSVFTKAIYRIKSNSNDYEIQGKKVQFFTYQFLSNSTVDTKDGKKYSFYISCDISLYGQKINEKEINIYLIDIIERDTVIYKYVILNSNKQVIMNMNIIFNSKEEAKKFIFDVNNFILNNIIVI